MRIRAAYFHDQMEQVILDVGDAGELIEELNEEISTVRDEIQGRSDTRSLDNYLRELRQIRALAQDFEV